MLRISILLALMVSLSAYGQITITKDHMPGSGDNIEYSTARPLNIDVSKTGADVTWDYTGLVNLDDAEEEYISSLKTPYLLSFGFTAFGKKLMDTIGFSAFQFKNIYTFYQNSSASFKDVGIGFQFAALPIPQTGKHSDPDEIFVFPLKYGNRDSTTFDVEVPISAGIKIGSFFRSGHRITTVDGWGTISTPYVKNVSCLRVKSVVTELDSIKVSTPSINFGQTITRVEYKWLSTTEKIPLLTITGNMIGGNFTPTSVQYRNEWSSASPITVDFESDKVSPKQGVVVSMTNKTSGTDLTYQWDLTPSTGFIFVNGTSETHENPKIVFQDTGWYDVALTASDKNGSSTETKTKYIHVRDKNSGIEQLGTQHIKVYPNPTKSTIYIQLPQDAVGAIELISNTGQVISFQRLSGHSTVDVSSLPRGIYYAFITTKTTSIVQQVILD